MEEAAVKFEVNKKEIFTIPNMLSTFRIFIAFLFLFNFERNVYMFALSAIKEQKEYEEWRQKNL